MQLSPLLHWEASLYERSPVWQSGNLMVREWTWTEKHEESQSCSMPGFFFIKHLKSDVNSYSGYSKLAFSLETARAGHVLPWEPSCLSDLLRSNAYIPNARLATSSSIAPKVKLRSESQRSRSARPLKNIQHQGGHETPQKPWIKPLIGFFSATSLCHQSCPSQATLCCLWTAETQPIFAGPEQLMILCVTDSVIHIVCAGREFPVTFYLSQSPLAV